jgi:hypothetical protein
MLGKGWAKKYREMCAECHAGCQKAENKINGTLSRFRGERGKEVESREREVAGRIEEKSRTGDWLETSLEEDLGLK